MAKTELGRRRRQSHQQNELKSDFQNRKVIKILVSSVDYAILMDTILLVLFGVIMVFSSSYYSAGTKEVSNYDIYFYLKKQTLWATIGFMSMYFVSNFNYLKLKRIVIPFYVFCNVCLVLVLFIGRTVNGAKRWLQIGPIGFQPSEVSKLAMILFLSYFITEHKKILTTWKGFFLCSLIVAVPTALTAIENMSTAIIIAVIGMSVIFVASPRIIYFVVAALVGVSGVVAMLLGGEQFRMGRIEAWKDPFSDPINKGYQTIQSLYAIASGGLFGLGLGQSRQKLGYIPEGHNDIIFAIICEELGLFGAVLLITLFIILIWRGVKIAMNATDLFGCLIVSGIIVMIAIQVILNIAVVTNTIPNTGVPLPFISYGGTSLLFMMTSVGIVLNISRYSKEERIR